MKIALLSRNVIYSDYVKYLVLGRPLENRTICLVFEWVGLKCNTINVHDVDFGSHLEFTI